MSSKLTKKELNSPDAFQSSVERISDYVALHRTRVTIAGVALACAIIIAAGIYFYWGYYSDSALKLYTKAQENTLKDADGKENIEENIKIYKELVDKYSYSWSGRMAYYHLGNIYYGSGQIDQAIRSYEAFAAKTRSDKTGLKFLALTSLGYAYEAKKDFKSALKYFEEAQNSYNTGFEGMGLRNIARAYEELNEKEKAVEFYKKALEKTTSPSATIFLKRKISALS
jgi:predicted negative regulator of RcsB-dependent stress response